MNGLIAYATVKAASTTGTQQPGFWARMTRPGSILGTLGSGDFWKEWGNNLRYGLDDEDAQYSALARGPLRTIINKGNDWFQPAGNLLRASDRVSEGDWKGFAGEGLGAFGKVLNLSAAPFTAAFGGSAALGTAGLAGKGLGLLGQGAGKLGLRTAGTFGRGFSRLGGRALTGARKGFGAGGNLFSYGTARGPQWGSVGKQLGMNMSRSQAGQVIPKATVSALSKQSPVLYRAMRSGGAWPTNPWLAGAAWGSIPGSMFLGEGGAPSGSQIENDPYSLGTLGEGLTNYWNSGNRFSFGGGPRTPAFG